MILFGQNNQLAELIFAKADDKALNVTLRASNEKYQWEVTAPSLVTEEIQLLSSWFRRAARRNKKGVLKFETVKQHLAFRVAIDGKGAKTLTLVLRQPYLPPDSKKEEYKIRCHPDTTSLVNYCFALKEHLPKAENKSMLSRMGMTYNEFLDFEKQQLPDVERHAIPAEVKKDAEPFLKEVRSREALNIYITHEGEYEKCNIKESFWSPFQLLFGKQQGQGRYPAMEEYEEAVQNNICRLLTERFSNYFQSSFFQVDARYKIGKPEFTPNRIDDLFVLLYDNDDFYKEEADKLVGSVYVKFNLLSIHYNPFIISIKAEPLSDLMRLFDYDFKKAIHFFKSCMPEVFIASITDAKHPCNYSGLNLNYDYWMGVEYKNAKQKQNNK